MCIKTVKKEEFTKKYISKKLLDNSLPILTTKGRNMKKEIRTALDKRVYLLGKDKYGKKYWLKEPSWDCDWYWRFGYITTYRNNNPDRALDTSSTQHANNFMNWVLDWGGREPMLVDTVLSDSEKWDTCELFKRFYMFKELAEYYKRGSAGVSKRNCTLGDKRNKKEYDKINKEVIPEIVEAILSMLRPLELQ